MNRFRVNDLRKQRRNVCLQTSCTMDQNLARLQNPHRFLRENRFLEGEDPSKSTSLIDNRSFFIAIQNTYFSKILSRKSIDRSIEFEMSVELPQLIINCTSCKRKYIFNLFCLCIQDVTVGASYQRGGPCQLRANRRAWPSQAPVGQFLCQSGPGAWRIRKPVRPQAGPTLGLLRRVWVKRGRVRSRSRSQQPTKLRNRGVNKCKSFRCARENPTV